MSPPPMSDSNPCRWMRRLLSTMDSFSTMASLAAASVVSPRRVVEHPIVPTPLMARKSSGKSSAAARGASIDSWRVTVVRDVLPVRRLRARLVPAASVALFRMRWRRSPIRAAAASLRLAVSRRVSLVVAVVRRSPAASAAASRCEPHASFLARGGADGRACTPSDGSGMGAARKLTAVAG